MNAVRRARAAAWLLGLGLAPEAVLKTSVRCFGWPPGQALEAVRAAQLGQCATSAGHRRSALH